jgi:cardiolipin synthase
MLRKTMIAASKRGVNINIIIPRHSDIGLVDVIRNRYLGQLYKNNIMIWYYSACNLHSKIVLVDSNVFCIGSSNFDYRSFRYQHEIVLQGKEDSIIGQIEYHINETLSKSDRFDYIEWSKRPFIQRLVEFIFLPFRHLF